MPLNPGFRAGDEPAVVEERIPQALAHEKAQAALAQAKKGTTGASDAAAQVAALQKEIPRVVAERDRAIARLRERIEGKLCVVGDTTTASADLKPTPVGPVVPGVTINLAALNTMLSGRYLSTPGIAAALLLTVVLAGTLSWVFQRAPAVWSFAAMAAGLLVVFGGHYLALRQANVLAAPVLPMTGVFACFLVVTTRRWWSDAREKQRVREQFQFYLHPIVIDKLTRNPELARLVGEDAELTILFADIRGFSSISEQLTAEELQRYLNGFFTPMSRIAMNRGGTIDKYIGDAMMLFYGVPVPTQDHAEQASLTAIEMMDRLGELQAEWNAQGLPEVRIGIGINTDVVRVGNFGSDDKFKYTVIGDGVNLASRLQGATKQYGVEILVSENTWKQLHGRVVGREIDRIRVKGRQEPTRIFHLIGKPPAAETTQRFLDTFSAGVAAYQARDWRGALSLFRQAQEIDGEDRPTQIYLERCENFLKSPPEEDWDGVVALTTK